MQRWHEASFEPVLQEFDDFRSNGHILDLFKRGAAELGVSLSSEQP